MNEVEGDVVEAKARKLLSQAVKNLKRLRRRHFILKPVNTSDLRCRNSGLISATISSLQHTGQAKARLELETEGKETAVRLRRVSL